MSNESSITPKGTVTLRDIGDGTAAAGYNGTATFKAKRGSVNASLAISDQTMKNVKSLQDVVATVDYKVPKIKGTVLNTKYDLGTKKWQAGATWDGTVANKASTVKLWYSNKDSKVAGETTVAVNKDQKANVTFNQNKLLTAKYTYTRGDFTYEPSYNFEKKGPAVAVTKRHGKDSFKASYDLKSEGAALEWNRKPFKVTVSSTVGKGGVGKPTVAAVFENVYNI